MGGPWTRAVGLVLARTGFDVDSFYLRFLEGIERTLADSATELLLQIVPTAADELATLDRWRETGRVDGVVIVDPRIDDPRLEWAARADALPAVVVADASVAGEAAAVAADDAAAMRAVVARLAQRGHRRIARVAGFSRLAHTRVRDEAFLVAAADHGVSAVIARTDFSMGRSASATRELLTGDDPPTALIYEDDLMAVAGLGAAVAAGRRVPDDVSIVAGDDSQLCVHSAPALTAFATDIPGLGAEVARRLLELIDGAAPAAHVVPAPPLVERASLGPAPARAAAAD